MKAKRTFFVTKDIQAPKSKRFFNFVIDSIAMILIFFIMIVAIMILSDLIGFEFDSQLNWIENLGTFEEYLINILVLIIYYLFFETMSQSTIGKFITRTIVVDKFGNKPTFNLILKRTFCRLIPFDGLTYFGENPNGWHDRLSETYVVEIKVLEKSKQNFYELEQIGVPENEENNDMV